MEKREDRGWKIEDRGWKIEDRGWRIEDGTAPGQQDPTSPRLRRAGNGTTGPNFAEATLGRPQDHANAECAANTHTPTHLPAMLRIALQAGPHTHIPSPPTLDTRHAGAEHQPPEFVRDLSSLEAPDYSVFPREAVVNENGHMMVMLSRGCPYNCYYCCNRSLSAVYPDARGYFRIASVDWCIELLERLKCEYPEVEHFEFEDDLLISNKPWFMEFAAKYREKIGLPYRACVRVECVTPEIVEALKSSGCRRVLLGLEQGNEEFRKKYLNRSYSNDLLVEKSRMLRRAGLDVFVFNIVGFPFETGNEMADTLRLNRRAKPDGGVCTFFYPYKHTQLHRICEDNGLLLAEEEMAQITNYNTRPSIRMTPEQDADCRRYQREITDFLEYRCLLKHVSGLPLPLPRPLKRFFSPYWYVDRLRRTPRLAAAAKWLYRCLGLKTVAARKLTTTKATADERR